MGSGGIIYIQYFIRINLGIHKFLGEIQEHRQHSNPISLLLFFQNKESRLETINNESCSPV
jgi:hypothetical protein